MAASKPSSIDDVVAFLRSAGDADDAAALDLGDLAGDRPDGAGGTGEHDRLAGLRLADIEQAEISGQPGHAQRAQVDRQRRKRTSIFMTPSPLDKCIFLDAEGAGDMSPTANPGFCDAITRPAPGHA